MPPVLAFSDSLHGEKYRAPREDHRESQNRICSALKDNDDHFKAIQDITQSMRYLFAGRIQASVGRTKNVTPYNCYVSGTIEDSFIDGHGSIMNRASEAASTMRMGGGIGFDFSPLRPNGSLIKKLQSRSSGPIAFMSIFDSVCRVTSSAGNRRGAMMGVIRIDHPDIEEFIHCKQNSTDLTGFNISIAVTDHFMECLITGRPFPLMFEGQVHREIDAADLWEQIMRSTWDWAEPGVLFIDVINSMNNLAYCERIVATNPCGEQPLPPYGACLLGSINLPAYVMFGSEDGEACSIDTTQITEDIPHIVAAMDNVIDIARYPLHEQEKEAMNKRRMGIGVTGLANAIEAEGLPYGTPSFCRRESEILEVINHACYLASHKIALKKGAFRVFVPDSYVGSKFLTRALDPSLIRDIQRGGIRNSHLTSIAPTGTISLCADNVSSGIEPVFSYETQRTVIREDGATIETVSDYGKRVFGVEGRTYDQVSAMEHLDVLATAYRHVDSAVSKTCNVPSDMPWDDFKDLYLQAWKRGCKGITTYRPDGKRSGILVASAEDDAAPSSSDSHKVEEKAAACYIDPDTGRKECE